MRLPFTSLPSLTFFSLFLAIISGIAPVEPVSLILWLFIAYILGRRLINLLTTTDYDIDKTGLAFISGFSLLSLALLIPYGFLPDIPFGLKNYLLLVFVSANLVFDIAHLSKGEIDKVKLTSFLKNIKDEYSNKKYLIILSIFIIGLLIRLIYQQQNSTSILPDGALYYSMGRALAEQGNYSVNLLNDIAIHSPFQFAYGLVPRTITWFILGSFFSFGGVSFECAKFVVVFFGSLLIFPVCDLTNIWFKEKYWIAGLIIAIHPTLLFFSVTLFGPNLISTVFAISAIVLLEYCKKINKISYKTVTLSALLLGASMLAHENEFVILYLLVYSFSLLTVFGFPKRKLLIIIPILAALYFTLTLGITWWNFFYPAYFFLVLIPLLVILRKDKWITMFIYMGIIFTLIFSVWLNRFYLYPELVINPTIQSSVRRQVSFYTMQNLFNGNIFNFIGVYQSVLIQSSLVSVLILGFLSLIILPRKTSARASYAYFFMMFHALALIFFVTEESGFFESYSTMRFFIGVIAFLAILMSGTIGFLHKQIQLSTRKMSGFAISILVLSAAFLPVAIDFYNNGYLKNSAYISEANYPEKLGIPDSIAWIENNTLPEDLILVASRGTTRVWSMEVSERTFASLNIVKNDTVLTYGEIDIFDVIMLASYLNASYIIFDPAIDIYGYTKLAPYYNRFTPKDIGRKIITIPEEITFSELLNQQEKITTLEITFVSNSTNKVVIFKPRSELPSYLWFDDEFRDGWQIFLNGTIALQNGMMMLTTPPFCNDKVYARYIFNTQINFTKNTVMIFKAEASLNSSVGFYLRFQDDTESLHIFDYSGMYVVDLGDFAGKYPKLMFAYNILKPNARNTNYTYTVSYDFFALLNVNN
jgi:hypothetical protein